MYTSFYYNVGVGPMNFQLLYYSVFLRNFHVLDEWQNIHKIWNKIKEVIKIIYSYWTFALCSVMLNEYNEL